MKKKATEMVCILDRSGSMYKKRKDTIGSFNQMLEKQKREPGEAYITTALFSDQCDVLYMRRRCWFSLLQTGWKMPVCSMAGSRSKS